MIEHDTWQTTRHLSINKKHQLLQHFHSLHSSTTTSFVEEIQGRANRQNLLVKTRNKLCKYTNAHFARAQVRLNMHSCNTVLSQVMHVITTLVAMLKMQCIIALCYDLLADTFPNVTMCKTELAQLEVLVFVYLHRVFWASASL